MRKTILVLAVLFAGYSMYAQSTMSKHEEQIHLTEKQIEKDNITVEAVKDKLELITIKLESDPENRELIATKEDLEKELIKTKLSITQSESSLDEIRKAQNEERKIEKQKNTEKAKSSN